MILAVFVAFIVEIVKTSEIPRNAISEFGAVFIYAGVAPLISYPATLLLGVPIYLALKKYYHVSLVTLSVASLMPGAIYGLIAKDIYVFLGIGYFSLCVAISFYLLLRTRE